MGIDQTDNCVGKGGGGGRRKLSKLDGEKHSRTGKGIHTPWAKKKTNKKGRGYRPLPPLLTSLRREDISCSREMIWQGIRERGMSGT